jgi:Xaa-Pro aminopeptidase
MRERLLELIERRGLGAVVLRRPENFAWYTGGGNSRVEYAAPEGVADVVVTPEAEWVLTSTIEGPRMRDEETPGFHVVEYAWEEGPAPALRELVGDVSIGADVVLGGVPRCYGGGSSAARDLGATAAAAAADAPEATAAAAATDAPEATAAAEATSAPAATGATVALDLNEDLSALRRVLDAEAIARLHAIGADLTAALSDVAERLVPGISEHEAASELAAACRARGLVPTVLLAATHERIARYRHPLATTARLERRAIIVASAQRGGLYANLTRIAWLEEPDPEIVRRQAACDEILARTRDEATLPGRALSDVFADIRCFYADAGFPDEWRLHHQGGVTGYASREVIATPTTAIEIEPGMAFAWNPSVTGAKAEETFVLTGTGPEIVAGAKPAGPDVAAGASQTVA